MRVMNYSGTQATASLVVDMPTRLELGTIAAEMSRDAGRPLPFREVVSRLIESWRQTRGSDAGKAS
jgi:hypothetical protein